MFSFLSIEFSLSFILFFCLYWSFRSKPQIQNLILILASYAIIYLMAGIIPTLILFGFTSIIFILSTLMDKYKQHNKKEK